MAKSTKIAAVSSREILDSRGVPTVEVEVRLESGPIGRAAVPSGASTGEHEAVELRDGDAKRFLGKGVLKAVGNVLGELSREVIGQDAMSQSELDDAMIALDGTPNKGRLGANAILGVSMAVSRAAAQAQGLPLYRYLRQAFDLSFKQWLLPAPMLNIVNGGRHADSGLDIQEFMIVPTGAQNFSEALRSGAQTYHTLKKLLAEMKQSTAVGDEGGFAPRLSSNEEALKVISDAMRRAGSADCVQVALDAAASEFYKDGSYRFDGKKISADELSERYRNWKARYSLISVEDPFAEDDWAAWTAFTAKAGDSLRVIGDDIFVTNVERIQRGIKEKAANAVLIKLNQIGTVTETVRAVLLAQKSGWSTVISHRSGETEDPYIADFAVALNAGAIKTGAPCRSERLSKYNQLLRIESELGHDACYAGDHAFRLVASSPAKGSSPCCCGGTKSKTAAKSA